MAINSRDSNAWRRPTIHRRLPARAFDRAASPVDEFTDGELLLARPIVLDGEVIGTVVIESDLSVLWAQATTSGLVVALVLIATFGVSVILASRMQRTISSPLLRLTSVTRAVTRDRVYDVRVESQGEGENEIADLIDGFNKMLAESPSSRCRARAAQGRARAYRRAPELPNSPPSTPT
jgi:methyl-accepting chemotaxis protein